MRKGQDGDPAYQHDKVKKDDLCRMWFEASWDQNGARCVNHKRWVDLGRPPDLGYALGIANPDDVKNGQIHCRAEVGEKLKADEDKALSENQGKACIPLLVDKGALVSNRSEMHQKNTAPPNIIPPPDLPRKCWDSPEYKEIGCKDPHPEPEAMR